jgi:hypothetical protein
MPTILRIDPYRFFFYASDIDEPVHIHVEREDNIAKFWVDPVRLQKSNGFSRHELNRISKIIEENKSEIMEAWHDYSGN